MLTRLRSLVRSGTLHLVSAPIRLLPVRERSRLLEGLTADMIANGGPVRFFAPTPLLQDRAASMLTKEPDTISWIDGISENAVFWDIGANVGVFSLYAACRAQCRVLAFEPSAGNFFVLARNVQLNGMASRVTAYCIAFAETTGLGMLNMSSPEPGSAVSQFGRAGELSRYAGGETAAAVQGSIGFTIDDFIARFQPPFPTHIKMDVDGLEVPILRGASETLRDSRLRSAMIELTLTDGTERNEAIEFLGRAGLALVATGSPQGAGGEMAANHLFERRSA